MTDAEIIAAEIRAAEVPMSDALFWALDRLERDAERYRWLKSHAALGIRQNGNGWSLHIASVAPDCGRDIDPAIDAAMRGEA